MPYDPVEKTTLSGNLPQTWDGPAPAPIDPETGQHRDYWILSEEERKRGFVRPLRTVYTHKACGSDTSMSLPIAETFAAAPDFYGRTFCAECRGHFPVAAFTWKHSDDVVGA